MGAYSLAGVCAVFLLVAPAAVLSAAALPLFDPPTCHNMCTSQAECPSHAACLPVSSSARCGICVCTIGFRPEGAACVPMGDGGNGNKAVLRNGGANAEAESEAAGAATAEADSPQPAFLSEWKCEVVPEECRIENIVAENDESDPMVLRWGTVPEECRGFTNFQRGTVCQPRMHGANSEGTQCAGGGQCTPVAKADGGGSYCFCPHDKYGLTCHSEKPNLCEQTTGEVPTELEVDKRYRHTRLPHTGSVMARHWAGSLNDCVRLCQWAGGLPRYPRCRSVNYGPMADGRMACELISVEAAQDSSLHSWLVDAPGWTYACCFTKSIEPPRLA